MKLQVLLVAITATATLLQICVSAPKDIHAAFHGGAAWRSIVRHSRPFASEFTSFQQTTQLCGSRNVNIVNSIGHLFGLKLSNRQVSLEKISSPPEPLSGHVVRTAARLYQKSGGSTPSSQYYTTRKDSQPMISVTEAGIDGDYNHYRTIALKSTADRAVSILTNDVSAYIRAIEGGSFASRYREGDLGENILIDGIAFSFFRVGKRCKFTRKKEFKPINEYTLVEEVIIEITEPMEPCANLCKLPYINDPSLSSAKDRVSRCRSFINALGQRDGLRGWYAKVIAGGMVSVGDSISLVESAS